jgi:hypothetical protein
VLDQSHSEGQSMQELLNGVRLDPSKVLLLGHPQLGARLRSAPAPSWRGAARLIVGLVKR